MQFITRGEVLRGPPMTYDHAKKSLRTRNIARSQQFILIYVNLFQFMLMCSNLSSLLKLSSTLSDGKI